jgi:hypothetical protein
MPEHWMLLLGLALAGWIFYDGMQVRERALRAGRDYCRNIGVQFLDDTVSRQRTGFARDATGTLRIRRMYSFEFTSDGERRYAGEIVMLGSRVAGVQAQLHRILH